MPVRSVLSLRRPHQRLLGLLGGAAVALFAGGGCLSDGPQGSLAGADPSGTDLAGADADGPEDTSKIEEASLDAVAPPEADTSPALDTDSPPDLVADVVADAVVDVDADAAPPDTTAELPRFSFFVTSLEAMRQLSGSQSGFGGDLRFGKGSGLEGADEICRLAAELGMPGAGAKVWRAYLSAAAGPDGEAVHAIDRIGGGPWYDFHGRLVASDRDGLLGTRPDGEAAIKNDLPNERGESQKNQPGPNGSGLADNHDVLTGSTADGRYASGSSTCADWTSTGSGRPMLGHSWPAQSGQGWVKAHPAAGCAALVNLAQNGPGSPGCSGVGCGGGYGAIYCFATTP